MGLQNPTGFIFYSGVCSRNWPHCMSCFDTFAVIITFKLPGAWAEGKKCVAISIQPLQGGQADQNPLIFWENISVLLYA